MERLQQTLLEQSEKLFQALDNLPLKRRIKTINQIRRLLSEHSPFANEPVDCVEWVPAKSVEGNDYNPNTVAPPEMRLLERSIEADGYTQPIVAYPFGKEQLIIVDGFHRLRVGKKAGPSKKRLHGYLPVVSIRNERSDESDRIAATIRHNRARGVHGVLPMTDIVVALLQKGWNEAGIARELGMDEDEVLRFKQVSGLPTLFQYVQYSKSWD